MCIAMDDDKRRTGEGLSKHHSNKHVTTACNVCRRKRTKCDGQMPCSSCSNTKDSCVYSNHDRRRQRHQRSTTKQTLEHPIMVQTTPGDQASTAERNEDTTLGTIAGDQADLRSRMQRPQQDAEHNGIAFTVIAGRPKLRSLAAAKPKSMDRSVVSPAMKDMQGKFDAREGTLRDKSDAGFLHMPPYRLRPQIVSTSPTPEDREDSDTHHDRPCCEPRPVQLVWQIERRAYAVTGYTRTFGNLPLSSAIKVNGYSPDVQARQNLNFSAPEYLIFPLADADDSPLSRAFTDFQQLGRRLIAERTPHAQVADQGLIDVTLFFRERTATDPVNASTWAAEMLRAFRGTFSDHLLLACAVCVGSLMRWFLLPTLENYANIPALARPTQLQRLKPHPSWVDLMIFPSFRNALVNSLRDWVEPCRKARWEFMWPYPLEEALVSHANSQQIFLTTKFAVHVDNPKNWLMQKSILEAFPEVRVSEMNISGEQSGHAIRY